jgi:hypothetical protein
MKVTESTINVQSSGIQSESFFNVKESNVGHIFSILRNKLYSNKPLAIIREYCTNAFDAHVEAGIPERPIEVSFPTAFKNSLTIRDFGHGLSESDVYNVFASYGESTKRNTNDQVGMMGLGSKSAFCYVNDFTITSYYGGKKSTYLAYIDETNIGKISKIAEEPTEQTGLAIDVVVKTIDLKAFRDVAGDFLAEFKPQPIIHNDDNVVRMMAEKQNESYLVKGDFYAIINRYYGNNSSVRMGNVTYPFSFNDITPTLSHAEDDALYCFRYLTVKLLAPIGSVVPSASRESLEMDDKTKSYIKDALLRVVDNVKEDMQSKYDACPSLYDFLCLLNKTSSVSYELRVKPKYNGIEYHRQNSVIKMKSYPEIASMKEIKTDARQSFGDTKEFAPDAKRIIFVYDDTVKQNTVRSRILNSGLNLRDAIILEFKSVASKDAIVNHTDWQGANFVDVSTLEYVKATKSSIGAFAKSEVYRYNGGHNTLRNTWVVDNLSLQQSEGIYVEIKRYAPVFNYPNGKALSGISELSDLLAHARYLGIKIDTLYGIKYSDIDKLGAGWVELGDYIQQALYNMTDDEIETINRAKISNDLPNEWHRAFSFDNMIDYDADMTRLKEIIAKYYTNSAYCTSMGSRITNLKYYGFDMYLDTVKECDDLINKTLDKHPILKCLFGYKREYDSKPDNDTNMYWKIINQYIKGNDYLHSEGLLD